MRKPAAYDSSLKKFEIQRTPSWNERLWPKWPLPTRSVVRKNFFGLIADSSYRVTRVERRHHAVVSSGGFDYRVIEFGIWTDGNERHHRHGYGCQCRCDSRCGSYVDESGDGSEA